MMRISEINIYPIKSLKGITLDSVTVEERGLRFDRRWMLTTPDGIFFTQREFPKMATVSVWLEDGGLGVAAEGYGEAFIPGEPGTGRKQQVTVWKSVCEAEVHSDVLNEWFSDVIGTDCQLVYMPEGTRRRINPLFDRGNEVVSFADGYPLMVLSEASLDELNDRLAASFSRGASHGQNGDGPPEHDGEAFNELRMDRFRPNFVVSGASPFAEDGWERVGIGDVVFRSTKPCERCVITTVDQETGEFTGKEPLKTLATFRMAKDLIPDRYQSLGVGANAVLFGQNLVPENYTGTVRVGDEIEVLES